MAETKFFMYKGFPLVRKGREIIYGNPEDEMITQIQIMHTRKVKDLEVADKVKVFLMLNDPEVDITKSIVRNCDRPSLFEALDVANVWLNRA